MTDAEGWPSPVEGVRLEIAPERVTLNHSRPLTITSDAELERIATRALVISSSPK